MYNKQSSVCLIRVQSDYRMSTNMLFCLLVSVLNLKMSGLIVALILSQNSFVCEGNN